jgi:dienelactone hydrolase
MADDALSDFTREPHTVDGKTKDVYWQGSGPAVVVMTEMPGITPAVADFARRLVAECFTVALPDLFGSPGREVSNGYMFGSLAKGCVSKEFVAFATGKTSPVIGWMRGLVAEAHGRSGVGADRGVGVVGMCFTGGFSLALAVDPLVAVGVLSQPSLPLPLGPGKGKRGADLGLSADDLKVVAGRVAADDVCAIGLRFTSDPVVPAERFASLREALGDAFIGVEIDSSEGNPHGFEKRAHSILTEEYRDEEGLPTKDAHDLVISHFHDRLD